METVTLYRPVGKNELALIEESDFSAFPPRLAEQPNFYPVLNQEYTMRIARDWNAKYNADKLGYVTKFEVRKAFLEKYETKIVGSREHEEYWIPAEDLEEFNRNIVGRIEVIAEFRGNERNKTFADDIAFHMTDWLADIEELQNIYSNIENLSSDEITSFVYKFLAHVPNHLNAAMKLSGIGKVEDVFQAGIFEDDK